MQKFKLFVCLLFLKLGSACAEQQEAGKEPTVFHGNWVYGFEQSVLETCDGQRYWMWVPAGFTGEYTMQGQRNPVRVSAYVLPPNPKQNMYSTLPSLQVIHITHVSSMCKG